MRIVEFVCDVWRSMLKPALVLIFEFATNRDCDHCKRYCHTTRGAQCGWKPGDPSECKGTFKKPMFERDRWI